ncbi:MAG: prephenate dehydrogenase/arogenate dehydrogenase family protein [Pseudomonadota bacterium]
MIRKLAIIGVGLIGGSMARVLRQEGLVQEIVGCGRGRANLRKAVEIGVIDHYTHKVAEAVEGADFVVLAVPLGAMRATFEAMRNHLADDVVLTDVGSVKGSVIQDAKQVFGEVPNYFVPGHPIAGTERSGVEAAFPELFRNRRVILTPLDSTDASALRRVERVWEYCGAEVTRMEVRHHDEVLAATSHLPHMLAYSLVDSLARMKENDEIFRFAAGGFRDFTRIASSNPTMWRDICLANSDALGVMLKRFANELQGLADTLEKGDAEGLLEIFERAKAARDRYIDGIK